MQDFTRDQLQASVNPDVAEEWIQHSLTALYADTEHRTSDPVVKNLTFEELVGALIAAQLQIQTLRRQINEISDRYDVVIDVLTPEQLNGIDVQMRAITEANLLP